jgi:hypothetical protein
LQEIKLFIEFERQTQESAEEYDDFNRSIFDEISSIPGLSSISVGEAQEAPANSRSSEIYYLGQFALVFVTSGAAVAALNVLNTWLGSRKIKVKIDRESRIFEGENLSKEQFDEIIKLLRDEKL